jgi:hypothetical protein
MKIAISSPQAHFCLLAINFGIWNFVLRFSHLAVDSGGIISSGMYFPTAAMTAQTFLEFATSSGTYSSAAAIAVERSLRGANFSTPLIAKEISLFGTRLSKNLRAKSSSLSGAYLSTTFTRRENPFLARDLFMESKLGFFFNTMSSAISSLTKILYFYHILLLFVNYDDLPGLHFFSVIVF